MNTLDLLIYAIVAVVVIGILVTLFGGLFPKDNLVQEIKAVLITAQTDPSLGKFITLGTKSLEKDFVLSKGMFDTAKTSLALECNNPKLCCVKRSDQDKNYSCDFPIEWDYTSLTPKSTILAPIGVRCIKQDALPICRIYIGAIPAQAHVGRITLNQENETITATIVVKNEGENSLADGTLTTQLQKRVNSDWIDTKDEFPIQTLITSEVQAVLTPRMEHTFTQAIKVTTQGEYRALFRFEGTNAGFDTNSIDFNVNFNQYCKPVIETNYQTIDEPDGTFTEVKKCENCNYAYECATAWQTKFPTRTYEGITKDMAYCTKQSLGYTTCEAQ